jgi:hypothetical protein
VKRIVLLLVIAIVVATATSRSAQAQRSGTMQVTARVLDTRDSWTGLRSAHAAAAHLANTSAQTSVTVETTLANVSVRVAGADSTLDRPRAGSVTINYLRN